MQNQTAVAVEMAAVNGPINNVVQSFSMAVLGGTACTTVPMSDSWPAATISERSLVTDLVLITTASCAPSPLALVRMIKIVAKVRLGSGHSISVCMAEISQIAPLKLLSQI